jgi:hypothetical protein
MGGWSLSNQLDGPGDPSDRPARSAIVQSWVRKPVRVEAVHILSNNWYDVWEWLAAKGVRASMTVETEDAAFNVIEVRVADSRDDYYTMCAYTGDWLIAELGRVIVVPEKDFADLYMLPGISTWQDEDMGS